MNLDEYKALVKQVDGKKLPDAVYIHVSKEIPEPLWQLVKEASEIVGSMSHIIKFNKREMKISLLDYPEFNVYAYPALAQSFTVDMNTGTVKHIDYTKRANPPILHRKETFVDDDYAHIGEFKAITAEGEALDLYENTRIIGTKENWEDLIKCKGYKLDNYWRLYT
jgi:DNA phosphorothioation-associated putative methyltransferase